MSRALVYVMDMESSLSDALVRRILGMNQYVVFRKWDMNVDTVAEVTAYKDSLKALIISGSGKNINSNKTRILSFVSLYFFSYFLGDKFAGITLVSDDISNNS